MISFSNFTIIKNVKPEEIDFLLKNGKMVNCQNSTG